MTNEQRKPPTTPGEAVEKAKLARQVIYERFEHYCLEHDLHFDRLIEPDIEEFSKATLGFLGGRMSVHNMQRRRLDLVPAPNLQLAASAKLGAYYTALHRMPPGERSHFRHEQFLQYAPQAHQAQSQYFEISLLNILASELINNGHPEVVPMFSDLLAAYGQVIADGRPTPEPSGSAIL
jgi:hypothetical protein